MRISGLICRIAYLYRVRQSPLETTNHTIFQDLGCPTRFPQVTLLTFSGKRRYMLMHL